ncbi:MAG: OmpA family protein [Xenophilus sp.]
MSTRSDDDSEQRAALVLVFAIIALVVLGVVGGVVFKYGLAPAAAPAGNGSAAAPVDAPATGVAVVTETVVAVVPEGAGIRVEGDTVNFYFATGSADIAPGAAEALAIVLKGVESGRKAVVSGFHDTTGDPAINERLAKQRAETVRDVLTGLGVPADRVTLEKPAATTGSGSNAQARRVEVRLVD